MNRKIGSLTGLLVLISFISSSICLAGMQESMLAPYISIEKVDIQDFFGQSKDADPFLPILRDIKGLKSLIHRAVVEDDQYALEILNSLAGHTDPIVRTMFVRQWWRQLC